jgi:hypothetical protein
MVETLTIMPNMLMMVASCVSWDRVTSFGNMVISLPCWLIAPKRTASRQGAED